MLYNESWFIHSVVLVCSATRKEQLVSNHPIVHIEFPATDPKADGHFYATVFGWKVETDPSYDYTMFSAEGGPGGGFPKAGGAGGPVTYNVGQPLVYIGTDDIDASLAKVKSHGGKVVAPKMEIPGVGWFAIFSDPAGNHVALFTNLPRQQ
jgi:predicted enzyme related to lactoylglutathione lyase